jgi:DNA-binding CsgD family transcriptional regulator
MPKRRLEGRRLVGRNEEIDRLNAALAALDEGRGQFVVVSGEAGIGKTGLVTDLAKTAAERGFATLIGRADEVESDRPFGPIADLADRSRDDLGPSLDALAAALRPSDDLTMADRTLVVAEALVDALEVAALSSPGALLVLEDLHWADAGTVAVLRRLPRLVQSEPVLAVVTTRSGHLRPDVDLVLEEAREAGAVTLPLGPLSSEAVAELVTDEFGSPPSTALADFLEPCTGNPFFVLELLAALAGDGALEVSTDDVDLTVAALPPTLPAALFRRLGFLPPDTLRLLQLAALLGGTFSTRDLATISDRAARDLLDPLDVASRGGLIEETGDRWRFRHDLLREALVSSLPSPMRKALHYEAARALAAAGAPLTAVAHHYALGADPGDREAVAALRSAATDALRISVPVGIDLLETALGLTTADDPERSEIVADVIEPLTSMARAEDAERLASEALARPLPPDLGHRVIKGLAAALYTRGDMVGARKVIEPVLAQDDMSDEQRSTMHSSASIYSLLSLDLEAMTAHAGAAVATAARTDDDYAIGLAANTSAMALLAHGRPGDALGRAAKARARWARGTAYRWAGYNPPFTAALVATELDDFDGAMAALAEGRRELEASGNVSWLVQYAALEALVPYLAGDLESAETACHVAQLLPLDYGPRYQAGVPSALLALIAWRRGDLASAAMHAEAAERHYLEHGAQVGIDLAWLASALVKEENGDVEGALTVLRLAWDLTRPVRYFLSWRVLAPHVARVAAGRDMELADLVAEEADDAARRNPVASAQGAAAVIEGLVRGDVDRLLDALASYEQSPRRLDAAFAAAHAARALSAAGRRVESRRCYAVAHDHYAMAGADGDLERLRLLAGRRRRGPLAPRPTTGWESLTRSEREVVAFLPEGLTNRQIGDALGISRRTVETHLSHVFAKVGVSTRVQLAAAAAQRG